LRIREVTKLEDCFDGSAVFGYSFDEPWTREAILGLKLLGAVDYFPDFPRPFFRLRTADGMQARGVEGERSCQVVLPQRERDRVQSTFEEIFTSPMALLNREEE
jgi:hypothetical protein